MKKGGVVSHLRNEIEVSCLPKDLPEFVDVDLSKVEPEPDAPPVGPACRRRRDRSELSHGRDAPGRHARCTTRVPRKSRRRRPRLVRWLRARRRPGTCRGRQEAAEPKKDAKK